MCDKAWRIARLSDSCDICTNVKLLARDAYAASTTSVRLSVTLVDCDHIVQQKVEIGT